MMNSKKWKKTSKNKWKMTSKNNNDGLKKMEDDLREKNGRRPPQ
jgi:hypothetical protein